MTAVEESLATDIELFAEKVLGRRLWAHQLEVLTCPARYRVMTAGRQSGKSVTLSVAALFEAATRRNVLVLLVSAGEVASRRLLEECAALAKGPLLGGILDESRSELRLSNGSRILSVPASTRQIRGWAVDLLILDEAGFIPTEVWRAAEPSIIARPGSRVILASSPWGSVDDFFRSLWTRGMESPDDEVTSWHWPSSISPIVKKNKKLLEEIRKRESAEYFAREYLAEWTDSSGAYFTEEEISAAVAPYTMVEPERLIHLPGEERWRPVAMGVDWGMRDANVFVLLGLLDPNWAQDGRWRVFVPWFEAKHDWGWSQFIDRICDVCGKYYVRVLATETNGVGAYPSDDLKQRLWKDGGMRGHTWVSKIWTDSRRKQSGFGMIKTLLQDGRLILPNEPELLKQLRCLEFEQMTGGSMRIAVPERSGHDDIAMGLMQAVSCVHPFMLRDVEPPFGQIERNPDTVVYSRSGIQVPRVPFPAQLSSWLRSPKGEEQGEVW